MTVLKCTCILTICIVSMILNSFLFSMPLRIGLDYPHDLVKWVTFSVSHGSSGLSTNSG